MTIEFWIRPTIASTSTPISLYGWNTSGFSLSSPLSNTDFSNDNNLISVYPNPTSSKISINCSNQLDIIGSQVKITSTLGQVIYKTILNQKIIEIPLSSIAANGLYFVSITDLQGKIISSKKIILQ
jgi:hypothetical protein